MSVAFYAFSGSLPGLIPGPKKISSILSFVEKSTDGILVLAKGRLAPVVENWIKHVNFQMEQAGSYADFFTYPGTFKTWIESRTTYDLIQKGLGLAGSSFLVAQVFISNIAIKNNFSLIAIGLKIASNVILLPCAGSKIKFSKTVLKIVNVTGVLVKVVGYGLNPPMQTALFVSGFASTFLSVFGSAE